MQRTDAERNDKEEGKYAEGNRWKFKRIMLGEPREFSPGNQSRDVV
jgi:hypothetical protein